MASIVTRDNFVDAANQWILENPLTFSGVPFVDGSEQKIYDETEHPDGNGRKVQTLIVAPVPELETALDAHNAAQVVVQQNESTDTTAKQDMIAAVEAGLTQIANDIATIDGGATNAELQQILRRTLNRQDRIIRAIRGLIRNR